MSNHHDVELCSTDSTVEYQATSYYRLWPWCFIPIEPPASEHRVEANTKRPCILPACHWCGHIIFSHIKITMTLSRDVINVSIVCPRGLQVVPPHRLGRLDEFDGHTEIVIHRGRGGPVLGLSHSRLALPAPHIAALKAERRWILVTTDVRHLSWIASGSHLAHLTTHTTHTTHTTQHLSWGAFFWALWLRNDSSLHLQEWSTLGPVFRSTTTFFQTWINPKNHWENWKIGNFSYILCNCIRLFFSRFFYVFCRATTISTTPSVSIRPSAAAAWRFKGQACPKSWHSQIDDFRHQKSFGNSCLIKWKSNQKKIGQWY